MGLETEALPRFLNPRRPSCLISNLYLRRRTAEKISFDLLGF